MAAQNCALIDGNGNVVNVIMADPSTDPAPAGYALLAIPSGTPVDTSGWTYSAGAFVMPTAMAAAIAAQAATIQAQGYSFT